MILQYEVLALGMENQIQHKQQAAAPNGEEGSQFNMSDDNKDEN